MYADLRTDVHVHTLIHEVTYGRTGGRSDAHVNAHTLTYTFTYTYSHTHTHTHIAHTLTKKRLPHAHMNLNKLEFPHLYCDDIGNCFHVEILSNRTVTVSYPERS